MDDPNGTALVHCTSCGKRQAGVPDLCEFCRAPLTPHAGTDPILGIMARGFAAYQATRNPGKPIVVVGMWLWMTPLLVFGLMMSVMTLSGLLHGINGGRWAQAAGALLGLILSAAFVLIPFTILVRTTEAYFRNKSQLTESSAEESSTNQTDEPMSCLACGQKMAEGASVCTICGWSFSDSEQ
jgi:hypothetical protein